MVVISDEEYNKCLKEIHKLREKVSELYDRAINLCKRYEEFAEREVDCEYWFRSLNSVAKDVGRGDAYSVGYEVVSSAESIEGFIWIYLRDEKFKEIWNELHKVKFELKKSFAQLMDVCCDTFFDAYVSARKRWGSEE